MSTNNIAAMAVIAAIMIATYFLISTEKLNKTLAALIGGLAVVLFVKIAELTMGFIIFTDEEIFTELIDWETIAIVVSVLIIVEMSRESGLFDWITIKIVRLTEGEPTKIFLYMNLLTFGLSAVTSSPAFIIVGALTLVVTKNLDLDPLPFLVSEMLVANIAGMCTVISSFVNILIASSYNLAPEYFLSYEGFVMLALPIGLALIIVNLFVFKLLYGPKIREDAADLSPDLKRTFTGLNAWQVVPNRGVFYRSAILLIATIAAFAVASFINVPFFLVALTSAILFIFFSDTSVDVILHKVDWEMLFFFIGIFVLVGGAHKVGILDIFADSITVLAGGNKYLLWVIIIWLSGVLSGFMDNVSVTAVLVFVIPTIAASGGFSETSIIWATIIGANLGACLTPIGGVSNIIGMGLLKSEGRKISWLDFMKVGSIITVVSLAMGTGYIFLLSWLLGW